MSLQTWMSEFYSETAAEAVDRVFAAVDLRKLSLCKGWVALVDHSIRKWEGMRKGNLNRHGISFLAGIVYGEYRDSGLETLRCAGAGGCTLCRVCTVGVGLKADCSLCPLYAALGGVVCCEPGGPYRAAIGCKDDVEPLLGALRIARRLASGHKVHVSGTATTSEAYTSPPLSWKDWDIIAGPLGLREITEMRDEFTDLEG